MRVTQTYPTGETRVLIHERKYPNGPLSQEPEDVLQFLEYNVEQMRLAAASMPANKQRQDLILERERQMVEINKLKRQLSERFKAKELDK
jgi:hypothetical protein